jgi:hypothetical protein
MPAHVEKQGKKWRVVDPGGNLVKTKKGNPVDGGGFDSEDAAQRQASAINISLHERGKI